MQARFQRTLKKIVSYSGVGLHTGKEVSIRFCPAPVSSGITFVRTDLPNQPEIPAGIEYVKDTSRSTTLGIGSCTVHTVEHVLAALCASGVDNLRIELTAGEPPICDGSSLTFVQMINEAGVCEQEGEVPLLSLKRPIYYSSGETHLVALPANEYRISYTLHYPKTSVIRSQFFSTPVNWELFQTEIAPCRTFALYEEINHLMQKGLIRGGSLENAVVIKDDVIFSKEGLRFSDEMARHKVLDLIGDLSLVRFSFHAHIIAIRSGHASNVGLGREILQAITSPASGGVL